MPANRFNAFTDYGVGIGLRVPHYDQILSEKPVVDWFEIISENYMVDGGRPLKILDRILEQYRVVQRGVSMYFGSAQALDREHLKRLKELTRRTHTPWLSDHLCWGSVDGRYTHDLLPLPYTFEAVQTTARRIREVQDIEAFDGASLTPLGGEDFAGLGAGSTLRLQPHLQLLDLQYAADEVVLAVRKSAPEIDIASNAMSGRRQAPEIALPEVTRSGIYLAVHRFEECVYYRRIDREEFLLLADLRDGDSIATAIERAFEGSNLAVELQAVRVQEYFAHAAELGWFCLSATEGW